MHGSIGRKLTILLAAVLVLVVMAVLSWRVFGPAYLESRLRETLAEQGLTTRSLTLDSVGLRRAVLTEIEFIEGATIETIEFEYGLAQLVRSQRFERLIISGLRLDADSLTAARDRAGAQTGPTAARSPIDLPVDEIVLRDSRIAIGEASDGIDVALALEAVSPAEGGLAVTGIVTIRGESGEIETPFTTVIGPDGSVELTAMAKSGRLAWRGATLNVTGGILALSGSRAAPDQVDVALQAQVTLPDGSTTSLEAVGGLNDGTFTLQALLAEDDDGNGLELTGALKGISGPSPTYESELAGDLELLGRVAALAGFEVGRYDDGRLMVRLSGRMTRPSGGALQAANGRILVLGQGTMAGGGFGTVDLAASYAFGDGRLRMTGDRPVLFGWRRSDRNDTYSLELGKAQTEGIEVRLSQVGTGWTLVTAGPYSLTFGHSVATGEIDLTASLDETEDGYAGPIFAKIGLSGQLRDFGAMYGGHMELDGRLALSDGLWRFQPQDCMPIGAQGLAIFPTGTQIEELAGCLAALPGEPMLALYVARPDDLTLALGISAEPVTVVLDAGSAQSSRLEVALPEATVRMMPRGLRADVSVSGAKLALSDPAIAFEDIEITAAAVPDTPMAIRLDSLTVRSSATPALFTPVSVVGDSTLSGHGVLEFQGTLQGGAGAVTATIGGAHDAASRGGRLEVRFDPISFAPGVRQPVDLAPVLASMPIADVTGSIGGVARLAWGERLTSSAELVVEDMTVSLGAAVVRSIDGRLRADSLSPLNLPDGQLLALGGARLALELEEGALAFGLADGERLSVQGLGFGLAGGSLAVEPFQARLGDRELPLAVRLLGIDLARLSKQFPLEGLAMTGRIDGRVPLRLTEDTISIENGVVTSTEPGAIRYVTGLPVGGQGEGGIALLLNAVRNFQYESLRATLNGRTGEDLNVAIRLAGANPDLFDGFPVALNVNLSGALDQILLSGLRSLAIADEAGRIVGGE